MRRLGAATTFLLCAAIASSGCTGANPAPDPTPQREPGQVIELFPGGLRPPEFQDEPDSPFLVEEPIALLSRPTSSEVDVVVAAPRNFSAAVYRLQTPVRGPSTMTLFPTRDGQARRALATEIFVSSAARSTDGTTWIVDNPAQSRSGQSRLLSISPDGSTAPRETMAGLRLSRDRVRLIVSPDGQVGYLSDGRPHALPGGGVVPPLSDVQQLKPTGDGGYLAAFAPGPRRPIRVSHISPRGSGTPFSIPPTVAADPLRTSATDGGRTPAFAGTVVGLATDGDGGAYLAVTNRTVDDALGVDLDATSMVLHADADGTMTMLMRGQLNGTANCPPLPRGARLADAERNLGRITDLMLRGDQLMIADAACRRVLAVHLERP
jgi:hypothetical protein